MRIAVGIEYDGRHFHGWETQRNGETVQSVLESALGKVADTPVHTICAGRTDSGVHALGQVVHFDVQMHRDERAWIRGSNSYLPESVSVIWAHRVSDSFHARFSAQRRYYRYIILNRDVRPGVLNGRVTWAYQKLDEQAMARAALALVGQHDFSAYRAAGCQAQHAVRTIYTLTVKRCDCFVVIDISANAFLQHMVRNIVGVLLAIGSGQRPVEWADEVLATQDRRCAGVTAKPFGLYFTGVSYPDNFNLPTPSDPSELLMGTVPMLL